MRKRKIAVRSQLRQKLGKLFLARFFVRRLTPFSLQIEYFNKRRILAEQQKDLLAQSKMQAQAAKQR